MQKSELLDALSLLGSVLELPNLSETAKAKVNDSIMQILKAIDTMVLPLASSLKLS